MKDLADITERMLAGEDMSRAASSRYARIPLFWTDVKWYAMGLLAWILVFLLWLIW